MQTESSQAPAAIGEISRPFPACGCATSHAFRFRIKERKRHTEELIFAILKEHEVGMKTADRARPPTPLSVLNLSLCESTPRVI